MADWQCRAASGNENWGNKLVLTYKRSNPHDDCVYKMTNNEYKKIFMKDIFRLFVTKSHMEPGEAFGRRDNIH